MVSRLPPCTGCTQRQSGVFTLPCISGWQGLAGHQAGEVQRALAVMEPGLPYPSPPRISPPPPQFSPISRLGRDFQTHAAILFQKDSPQAMGVVREVRTRAMSHMVEGLQLQDLKQSHYLRVCSGPAPLAHSHPHRPMALDRCRASRPRPPRVYPLSSKQPGLSLGLQRATDSSSSLLYKCFSLAEL